MCAESIFTKKGIVVKNMIVKSLNIFGWFDCYYFSFASICGGLSFISIGVVVWTAIVFIG
jgi:hypothetical protein